MDTVVAALNRIEGQVRGVKKMYEEGRECASISQQIVAIQSALKRVGGELLKSKACECAESENSKIKIASVVDSLLKMT